jgi:hypothetical protein
MEYYDSIGKTDLQVFYMNKSSRLLQNEKVGDLLDKKMVNLDELKDIQLFKSNPYQIVRKNRRRSVSDQDLPLINYSATLTETSEGGNRKNSYDKKLEDKKLIKMKTKQEVSDLDIKADKFSRNINKDMTDQRNKFEEMKKKRLEKQLNSNKST